MKRSNKGLVATVVVVGLAQALMIAGCGGSSSTSGSSSSNGWTSAEKSHLLEECATGVESGGSTQACDCALRWLEGHLSPTQLINAAAEGNYFKEGSELLAACPGVKGTGVLGQ